MKKTLKLQSSTVHAQLALCAAAVAGTAAVVPEADAAIITFSVPITVPNNGIGVYIDLATGATSTTGSFAGFDFNPYGTASGLGFFWDATAGGVTGTSGGTTYLSLSVGSTISAASFFTRAIQGTSLNYRGTGTEILGFRFTNESTGLLNFGYLTITTNATTGFPATVVSWSFDNTGAAITVVPEPSTIVSLLSLAVGAIGMREWRRRRAA
jgi:hypothetical protein